jgi:hypothetical protein
MHPLDICDFDPVLLENLNLYDTKKLMVQLCMNMKKLKMDEANEVFNDENFINKVRFFHTKEVVELTKKNTDLWECSPSIDKCTFYIIPELVDYSPGTYACKSFFSGKTCIEHFILLKGILPYASFRVFCDFPYADGIYTCIQKHIDKNNLSDTQQNYLIKYLISDSDPLILEATDPFSSDFLCNTLRICMESIKRLAYV